MRRLKVGLWIWSSLAFAGIAGAQLDPKTYASPSGAVELFVDPSRPSGGGPATYRCTRSGIELWSGTRPYTLWTAEVTDEGLVAGYAFGAGYAGGPDDSLTIVLIAPDGSARLEERSAREGLMSDLTSPDPFVVGLFLDPDVDRLVVRTSDGWAGAETWWTYSLSDGAPGPRLDPLGRIEEVRPVPGTSLVLVRQSWADFQARQYGAVFRLVDREARDVWRLDLHEDHTIRDARTGENRLLVIGEQEAILSVERGRFTLHEFATGERVTFDVEHRVTGTREGWEVREAARATFVLEAEPAPAPIEPPALSLEHLGSIRLGSPATSVPGDQPAAPELGKIGVLTLGDGDAIYAADERTGAVHVFRPDGTLEHVCATEPHDFRKGILLAPLTVTDAGEVFLGEIHFDAGGVRLGRSALHVDRICQDRYAQRGSDRFWIRGYQALYLVDSRGEVVRKIERTPDNRWLRELNRVGIAPDGSIALATGNLHREDIPGIHIYSADGEPLRSFAPPDGMTSWATFAFDGQRLGIGVERKDQPGAVVLMDAQGRTLGTLTPAGSVEFWQPFFAASGKELWLFDGERTIERFALP